MSFVNEQCSWQNMLDAAIELCFSRNFETC